MTIRQNQGGSASIEAYSLGEFTKEVVELCQGGYRLNWDLNEGNPHSFGVFMTITMYPTDTKVVKIIESVKNEVVQDDVLFNNSEQSPKENKTEKIDGRRKKS